MTTAQPTAPIRATRTETPSLIAPVVETARPPKPALADAPAVRIPAMAAMALAMAGAAAMPAGAQQVGWHPATSARPMLAASIDPNTFILGHPASPTNRGGHAGGEHPAVLVARHAGQRGIDPNTFIVQPPASVTWIATPPQDEEVRYAQTGRVQTPTAQ